MTLCLWGLHLDLDRGTQLKSNTAFGRQPNHQPIELISSKSMSKSEVESISSECHRHS